MAKKKNKNKTATEERKSKTEAPLPLGAGNTRGGTDSSSGTTSTPWWKSAEAGTEAREGRSTSVRDMNRARQRFAWGHVRTWDKNTARRIQGLPVQLRTQGLSTTVAVLLREDRGYSRDLLRLLAEWLLTASPNRTLLTSLAQLNERVIDGQTLLEVCLELNLDQQDAYLAAQDYALALLADAKLLACARYPSEVYRE